MTILILESVLVDREPWCRFASLSVDVSGHAIPGAWRAGGCWARWHGATAREPAAVGREYVVELEVRRVMSLKGLKSPPVDGVHVQSADRLSPVVIAGQVVAERDVSGVVELRVLGGLLSLDTDKLDHDMGFSSIRVGSWILITTPELELYDCHV